VDNTISYAAEFIADNSGKWCGNGIRLPTHEQALAYGIHKQTTWVLVRAVRVVPSTDAPNYTFEHGGLRDYSALGQALTLDRQGGTK
jgi:hypothetical protein